MIYIVVNEGEIVMATRDEDKALGFAIESTNVAVAEAVEESGRDIEDLTDEELGEFNVKAGFDGGYYAVEEISEEDFEKLDTVETEHHGSFETSEIAELLALDEDEDDFFDEGFDEFDGGFEDDFDDGFDDGSDDDFDDDVEIEEDFNFEDEN